MSGTELGANEFNYGLKDPLWAQRELLSRTPLFSGLTKAKLDELLGGSRVVECHAQDTLFQAGASIREAYVLISGTVKRATTLSGELEKVIELAQGQQVLGLGEVFAASNYASFCQAITPCIVVAVDVRRLRAIARQDLDLGWQIIQALAQRQQAIEFDVSGYHYCMTGTQRLLDYLVELAGERPGLAGETTVTLKTSKKMIAARLGMSPETFSRSLRLLSESGVIVVEGRNVHIQNAALLNTERGNKRQLVTFPRKPKFGAAKADGAISPGALINLCGRQRVLSQRMAIAWGLAGRNIAPVKSLVKLRQLEMQFERNLKRLNRLDLSTVLAERLATLKDAWRLYRQALFEAEPTFASARAVLDLSEEILLATDRLTYEAEKQSATPEAHFVNIAGRNRMLSQRIGKLFLFREWGLGGQLVLHCLEASRIEFECNLAELQRSGKGIPELAAQLDEVDGQWRKFESMLIPSLANIGKTRYALTALAAGERLFRHADTAVKLYERLAD